MSINPCVQKDNVDKSIVYIMPVSGGAFVTQLAALQHLSEQNIKPTMILASSGGNVAAYIGLAADWDWAGIGRIASEFNNSMLVTPWSDIPGINYTTGYFKGSMYKQGKGVLSFLDRYFDSETITSVEIWTGTYNKTRQKAQFFCNRNVSQMDVSYFGSEISQCLGPIFAGGDIELISKYSVASASIPVVVQPQELFGDEYIDGGVFSASPLTMMHNMLLNYSKDENKPLHLVYINSRDLSNHDAVVENNVIHTVLQATDQMIRSQNLIDRASAWNILNAISHDIGYSEFPCNYENMSKVSSLYEELDYSLLEIFPNKLYSINIANFGGSDVTEKLEEAYKDCSCRFWWVKKCRYGYADDMTKNRQD